MGPNCLIPSHIVPSKPGFESFSKELNEVELFWGPVSIKLHKDELEMLNPEFLPIGTRSLV